MRSLSSCGLVLVGMGLVACGSSDSSGNGGSGGTNPTTGSAGGSTASSMGGGAMHGSTGPSTSTMGQTGSTGGGGQGGTGNGGSSSVGGGGASNGGGGFGGAGGSGGTGGIGGSSTGGGGMSASASGSGGADACPFQGPYTAESYACSGTMLQSFPPGFLWTFTIGGSTPGLTQDVFGCVTSIPGTATCMGDVVDFHPTGPTQCDPEGCLDTGMYQCGDTPTDLIMTFSQPTSQTLVTMTGAITYLTTCSSNGQDNPVTIDWKKGIIP